MKNLQYTLEGILSPDLDKDIETNVIASRINKIRTDAAMNCKDVAGRKVKLRDTVLMFQPGQLVVGTITGMERGGTQYVIAALDNPENIYYPLSNCVLKIKDPKKLPDLIKIFGL